MRAFVVLIVFLFSHLPSCAQEGQRIATPAYWTAVGATALSVYADAYSTAHYVGHTRRCAVEGWSPWLYGRKPPVARVYGVMTAELVTNSIVTYYLKKRRHRLWVTPLMAMTGAHGMGAIHNVTDCPD